MISKETMKSYQTITEEETKTFVKENKTLLDELITKAKLAMLINKNTIFLSATALKNEPEFSGKYSKTACANGKNIYIFPNFFKELSYKQRFRTLFHESFHNLMGHCNLHGVKYSTVEHQLLNIAADCVVESTAEVYDIGKGNYCEGVVRPDKNGSVVVNLFGEDYTVENCHERTHMNIYEELKKYLKDNNKLKDSYSNGELSETMDKHNTKDFTTEEEIELEQELRKALTQHRLNGTMPSSLARILEEMLKGRINWKSELRNIVTEEIRSNSSYQRESRRRRVEGLIFPSKKREGLNVTFAIDTSGSITNEEIQYYYGEIVNIFNQYRDEYLKVNVMLHTSNVYNQTELTNEKDFKKIKLMSGGTSHEEVFEIAEKEKTQVLVCLTDGYSSFPEKTNIKKVLWLVTNDRGIEKIPSNLGKKIYIDLKR